MSWWAKCEKAIAGIIGLLASYRTVGRVWNLDTDRIPTHERANLFSVFFIHPSFYFTPPKSATRSV